MQIHVAKTGTNFINWVPDVLIRERSTKDGSKTFASVSIPTTLSTNGYGTIAVSSAAVKPGRKDGYKNIVLGEAARKIKLNVANGDGYEDLEMTVEALGADLELANEQRKALKAAEG